MKSVFRFTMGFKLNHDLQVKYSLVFVYKNIKNTFIFPANIHVKFLQNLNFRITLQCTNQLKVHKLYR